jgi:hypothetical protein
MKSDVSRRDRWLLIFDLDDATRRDVLRQHNILISFTCYHLGTLISSRSTVFVIFGRSNFWELKVHQSRQRFALPLHRWVSLGSGFKQKNSSIVLSRRVEQKKP